MSTVFITGANKGLGRALTEHYSQRPNYTVIATVRNIGSEQAKSLSSIPTGPGSRLIVVKLDSQSETDAVDAVKSIMAQGVAKLDILIANAGIYTLEAFVPIKDMKSSDLTEHFDINATGAIRLFQAVLPLLEKAERPVFMTLSSTVATIGGMEALASFTLPSYGASKAALNFLIRRIHFEHPNIVAFVVHPGAVSTEGGDASARRLGIANANPTPVEDSVNWLAGKVDGATREGISGKFLGYGDEVIAW